MRFANRAFAALIIIAVWICVGYAQEPSASRVNRQKTTGST